MYGILQIQKPFYISQNHLSFVYNFFVILLGYGVLIILSMK